MSQVFKILTGIDKVDSDKIFARRQVNHHTTQSANPMEFDQETIENRTKSSKLWISGGKGVECTLR
jgi:hypothetical protein